VLIYRKTLAPSVPEAREESPKRAYDVRFEGAASVRATSRDRWRYAGADTRCRKATDWYARRHCQACSSYRTQMGHIGLGLTAVPRKLLVPRILLGRLSLSGHS